MFSKQGAKKPSKKKIASFADTMAIIWICVLTPLLFSFSLSKVEFYLALGIACLMFLAFEINGRLQKQQTDTKKIMAALNIPEEE